MDESEVRNLELGKNIKRMRERAGLSQRELSKRVYVSEMFISFVERGAKKPSVDTFARMAAALGCSMDELYGVDKSA